MWQQARLSYSNIPSLIFKLFIYNFYTMCNFDMCFVADIVDLCMNISCPEFSVCIANESRYPVCDCHKGYTLETSDSGPVCKGMFSLEFQTSVLWEKKARALNTDVYFKRVFWQLTTLPFVWFHIPLTYSIFMKYSNSFTHLVLCVMICCKIILFISCLHHFVMYGKTKRIT